MCIYCSLAECTSIFEAFCNKTLVVLSIQFLTQYNVGFLGAANGYGKQEGSYTLTKEDLEIYKWHERPLVFC